MALLVSTALVSAQPQTGALTLESANGACGVQALEATRWGTVRAAVSNRGSTDASVLVVVSAAESERAQFASRAWLPPRSTRLITTPFLADPVNPGKPALDLRTRLVSDADSGERAGAPVSGTIACRPADSRFDSAILADDNDQWLSALVSALRAAAGLKPTNTQLVPSDAPATPEAFDALDCVFACPGRLSLDPRRTDALRRWLTRGGHLWILFDGTTAAESWCASLLGDSWDLAVIDSVEATRFTIDGPAAPTKQELDYGVPLVRVMAPGFEVSHRVDRNPVAMRKPIGRGELVVTTLAPRGWLSTDRTATPALKDFQAFIAPATVARARAKPAPVALMDAFDEHARREIGYRVIDRGWVVLAFGVAFATVLAAGLQLARRGRLEFAALASVLCAAAAAGLLIGLGRVRQAGTPTTLARVQFVRFDDAGRVSEPTGELFERLSLYTAPSDTGHAAAIELVSPGSGGALYPERTASGGATRLCWTDANHVRLEGLDTRAASVRSVVAHSDLPSERLTPPPHAEIELGAEGLSGRVDLAGLVARGDPILATPTGCLACRLGAHDTFIAGPGDVLAPGAFTTGAMVTPVQASRQRVLAQLFADPGFVRAPSLLVWTDAVLPAATALVSNIGLTERGSALVSIPVSLARPPRGSRVSIPAPLIEFAPIRRTVAGRAVSAVYNPESRAWLTNIHQPMLVLMRWQLPSAVLPMTIDSATLLLDVHAPGRPIDVVTADGDRLRIELAGAASIGAGQSAYRLVGASAPVVQPDGSLLVGIDVHGARESAKGDGEGWTIHRMELSVTGETR